MSVYLRLETSSRNIRRKTEMIKLIAIVRHPVDYFNLVRLREWVIMLQASTMMLKFKCGKIIIIDYN